MPSGAALTTTSSLEIVAAYSAPQTVIPSVAATPGWQVVGAFFLPRSCDARLDMLALVSAAGLQCRGRLYDLGDQSTGLGGHVVSGSTAQTSSLVPERVLSGTVSLTGNHNFQIQVECTGAVGATKFAVVETATISD